MGRFNKIKTGEKITNILLNYEPNIAIKKISNLRDPDNGKKIGKKTAYNIFNLCIKKIIRYKKKYKFDNKNYMNKCFNKINNIKKK